MFFQWYLDLLTTLLNNILHPESISLWAYFKAVYCGFLLMFLIVLMLASVYLLAYYLPALAFRYMTRNIDARLKELTEKKQVLNNKIDECKKAKNITWCSICDDNDYCQPIKDEIMKIEDEQDWLHIKKSIYKIGLSIFYLPIILPVIFMMLDWLF